MSRRSPFRQADVTRALKGAVAAGMKPSGCKINSVGDIEVLFGANDTGLVNSFDTIKARANG